MKLKLTLFSALLVFSAGAVSTYSESLESDSVSPGQVSESVGSDTVPTEKLEDVTKSPDAISETVDEANESAEEKINNSVPGDKPLGVREAEGKVIGE